MNGTAYSLPLCVWVILLPGCDRSYLLMFAIRTITSNSVLVTLVHITPDISYTGRDIFIWLKIILNTPPPHSARLYNPFSQLVFPTAVKNLKLYNKQNYLYMSWCFLFQALCLILGSELSNRMRRLSQTILVSFLFVSFKHQKILSTPAFPPFQKWTD